jgi:type IV secretion system pilin
MTETHAASTTWFVRPRVLRILRLAAVALSAQLLFFILMPAPAFADSGDLTAVIDSIRLWVAGILAALATLYLTIGGVRYLMANGSPRAMEEGKNAIRSALIGYALAALAPLFVNIVKKVINA